MTQSTPFRLGLVVALLLGTAVFLRSRSRGESLPPRTQLDQFPSQLGEWQGKQIYIAEDIRKILGDGDFMQQVFRRPSDEPSIELFIAYFPSQRTGSTIHSPKNCLPGSGWVAVESLHVPISRPDGTVVSVNRYVIQKSNNRRLVIIGTRRMTAWCQRILGEVLHGSGCIPPQSNGRGTGPNDHFTCPLRDPR